VGGEVAAQGLQGVGLPGPHDGDRFEQVVALAGGPEGLAQDVELGVAEEAVAGEVVDELAGAGEKGGVAVPGAGWVIYATMPSGSAGSSVATRQGEYTVAGGEPASGKE
jgi:hypothetical protein